MWGAAKILAVLILFGVAFFSGIFSGGIVKYMESRLGRSRRFSRIVSLMNCFAGGVFFATCVLNILPEARESMERALVHWGWTPEYPFTELLLGLGFFLVMILEHGVHTCLGSTDNNTDIQNSVSRESDRGKLSTVSSTIEDESRKTRDGGKLEETSLGDDRTTKSTSSGEINISESAKSDSIQNDGDIDKLDILKKEHAAQMTKQEESSTSDVEEQPVKNRKESTLRGVMLLLVLSIHNLFDGLAVGLSKEEETVWKLLLALSIHKALVFFTIGLQTLDLLKSLRKAAVVIFVLSISSPLGIVLGEGIKTSGQKFAEDSASAVLQGLATGTFIYVTFFEILQREFLAEEHDLVKVFTTMLGFSTIAVIGLFQVFE